MDVNIFVSCLVLLLAIPLIPLIMAFDSAATPDELEQAVTAMTKIRACWFPCFSPDGTRLAFVSDLTGVPQIWTVDVQSGWPTLVTTLDDPVTEVNWSPNGQWLAFAVAPQGGMNEQLFLIHPDGSGMRLLTDGGKENNWLTRWSYDGQVLTFASNRERSEAMDAYLYDLATGERHVVAKNPGTGHLSDLSRDRRRGILYRMEHRSDNNLFLVDLQTHTETLLTPHDGPGSFDVARFSPDGATIYLSSNKDRDLIAFARVCIDPDGSPGPIEVLASREDGELQEFAVTDDGATAALAWNVAGQSELSFLDLASLQLTLGPKLPAEIIGALTFSKDGRRLAMVVSGCAVTADIWVWERDAGQLRQVTFSPHPGVDLTTLVRPTLVRFPAHDRIELSGWLYRPPQTSAPGPLVLSFHGGPEEQERPWFRKDYQALLAQGIAVFVPNVRGSAGFGKTFVNLDNGALRFNAITDIKTVVEYVVTAGIADPKRIGIMGESYGGYMVMSGLTEYPELFAAGADFYGTVNWQTFFAHTEPWMAEISKVKYGDPETEAELLDRLSPIHRIDRVVAPTMVLHGANDTNVPVKEAEEVVASLRQRGAPVEYLLFPDEGYGFRKVPNQVRATVAVTRWFASYLKVR